MNHARHTSLACRLLPDGLPGVPIKRSGRLRSQCRGSTRRGPEAVLQRSATALHAAGPRNLLPNHSSDHLRSRPAPRRAVSRTLGSSSPWVCTRSPMSRPRSPRELLPVPAVDAQRRVRDVRLLHRDPALGDGLGRTDVEVVATTGPQEHVQPALRSRRRSPCASRGGWRRGTRRSARLVRQCVRRGSRRVWHPAAAAPMTPAASAPHARGASRD